MRDTNLSKPVMYEICIKGLLEDEWSEWFDGMTLTADPVRGETIIRGTIIDQAALYGLLIKIRDLGMPLLTLNKLKHDEDK